MEKKIRITKANRFEDIKALLTGETPQYTTTIEDAINFLDHELEMLANKNKSGNKELTTNQKENEIYKEQIIEYLATLSIDSEGMTCAELGKTIPSLNDFTTQKISSLMRQLKLAGRVTATDKKGRTLFTIA